MIAESEDVVLKFVLTTGQAAQDRDAHYVPGSAQLTWSPFQAMRYVDANGDQQDFSPLVSLAHEAAHAYIDLFGWDGLKKWAQKAHVSYKTNGELFATFVEYLTGLQLGEIEEPRPDRSGEIIIVPRMDYDP